MTTPALTKTRFRSESWARAHNIAREEPITPAEVYVDQFIRAIEALSQALAPDLADRMGDDYVLAPALASLLSGFRSTLNFDLGRRLDMGTLDAWACDTARMHGLDPDQL